MTLFLYMLRSFLKYAIGALFVSTFLFMLVDFLEKSQRYFGKYQAHISTIGKYYLLQIPSLLVQNIPIAALLASVICMVILNRSNEITAMRAIGVSPTRLALPLVAGGLILSIASFLIGELLVPKASRLARFVENVEIEGRASSVMDNGSTWVRNDAVLYNFDYYEPRNKTISDLKIETMGKGFRPVKAILAKEAQFVEKNMWMIKNIRIYRYHPDGTRSSVEDQANFELRLPFTPENLEKERRENIERSLEDMLDQIETREGSGLDVRIMKMDMHKKLAFAFAALVVSLVGLRFGYHSERSVETVRGALLAIFIGLSYWLILMTGQTLGRADVIGPVLSAWGANVLVLAICLSEFFIHIRGSTRTT